ncbi:MAG TPA: DUF1778 domain-containing protein [Candidatus Acidoferrales bacterium]|nr:DUF1778 domain-containing protein [Candidatus Acidoferrales bacterium]
MAATHSSKMERLEARIAPQQKKLIERAAKLRGMNTTNFVLAAVERAAVETIRDYEMMALHGDAARTFAEVLLNPPAPNAALRAAAERHLSVRV